MKKLIIILIAAISFNAASAQSRNNSFYAQDRRQVTQQDNRYYSDNANRSNDYAYNNNNQWKNDRDRQDAYDRMHGQHDQNINGYRNDRSFSAYARDRRMREGGQERQQHVKVIWNRCNYRRRSRFFARCIGLTLNRNGTVINWGLQKSPFYFVQERGAVTENKYKNFNSIDAKSIVSKFALLEDYEEPEIINGQVIFKMQHD